MPIELPAWIPAPLAAWLPVLLPALAAMLLAHVGFRIGLRIVRHAVEGRAKASTVVEAARPAARIVVPLFALNVVLQGAPAELAGLVSLQRLVGMALIASVTWLVAAVINGFAKAVIDAYPITVTDNLGARRIHTQARVLARTVVGIVVLLGGSLMLMVLPGVRQLGASLLASAGLVGIVAGFAARPVLGNIIAGLQIGLTQPIRIDDVVIVEGEWGVIEEITSAYVVVRIWDQRRLVVPLSYWVEKPFQNWTRATAELIGTVYLWVDYRMPLAPLREVLQRTCEGTPLWDRRFCLLQVVEAGEHAMQLRCLVTAADASRAWDLRCHVREQLLDFMQREYPQFLPRQRAEVSGEVSAGQGAGPGAEVSAEGGGALRAAAPPASPPSPA
jgi:small-conductance mechanosensitive channel